MKNSQLATVREIRFGEYTAETINAGEEIKRKKHPDTTESPSTHLNELTNEPSSLVYKMY